MKVNYLSKKESAEIINRLKTLKWGDALREIRSKESILKIEIDRITLYKISKFLICERGNLTFPTLFEEYNQEIFVLLSSILVDMGAIPYIIRGANVMRPGVKRFEGDFDERDLVVVKDERNLKPVAIAISLKNSDECEKMVKGVVAENIHHIDDDVWKLTQKIKHLLDRV